MSAKQEYIPLPATVREHFANVEFQFLNVKGWLGCGQTENAVIKAECLVEDLQKFIAAAKAETTKEAA